MKTKLTIYILLIFTLYIFIGMVNPAHAAPPYAIQFSISIFVNPSGSAASKAIIGKSEQFRIATDANGFPLCQGKWSTWGTAATSSVAISTSQWSQITCTYDSTNLKIYINGVLAGTQAFSGVSTNVNLWKIGKDDSASSPYGILAGYVDQFEFYNYALTPDDVKANYDRGSSMQLGSSGSVSGTGAPTNAASGDYCVPGDTTTCTGPIGEWKMDEQVSGDSKTLYDTSGNGNNGTTSWGPNASGMNCAVLGKIGPGCQFDGADDDISLGNVLNMGTNNHTFEVWFKLTEPSYSDLRTLAYNGAGSGSNAGYWIFVDGSNSIRVAFCDGSAGRIAGSFNVGATLFDNQWHHLAVVFNRAGVVNVYRDGVMSASTLNISAQQGSVTNSSPYCIGATSSPTYVIKGSLDQVRVYDYARTSAQITYEYNKGKAIAEWRFNECSGNTVHDESGNGNTGTINLGASGQTAMGTCTDNANTPWWNGKAGKYGASVNFDGTDDYASIPDSGTLLDFSNTGQYTWSAWIKYGTFPASQQCWISKDTCTAKLQGFNLCLNQSGSVADVVICHQAAANNCAWACSSGLTLSLPSDTWMHVVVTYDGSSNWGTYINGVYQGTQTFSTVSDTTSSYFIGSGNGGGLSHLPAKFFNGLIDDVKIFNYALSPLQVKTLYNNGAISF